MRQQIVQLLERRERSDGSSSDFLVEPMCMHFVSETGSAGSDACGGTGMKNRSLYNILLRQASFGRNKILLLQACYAVNWLHINPSGYHFVLSFASNFFSAR